MIDSYTNSHRRYSPRNVKFLNLQNIPSHAVDIRHMFRATAASSISIDCTEDESLNIVTVSLSRYDSVYLENGEEKSVKDLVPGDSVKLIFGNTEVFRILKSAKDSSEDLSKCDLIFENEVKSYE